MDHQLSKQTHFFYFAAMAFHGMIRPEWSKFYDHTPLFKQRQRGQISFDVSIFFIVLFAVALIMNYVSDSNMSKPAFGGYPPDDRQINL